MSKHGFVIVARQIVPELARFVDNRIADSVCYVYVKLGETAEGLDWG